MLDVFLCHSPADRELAGKIGARLDRGVEANVWLEPCGRGTSQTMAAAWDGGLSSAAILLLLSPDAIPQRLARQEWQPLLKHLEGNASPPVGAILLDPCPYPTLLERRHFFRRSDDLKDLLRKIERWVMGLHQVDQPSFLVARLPWFQGRDHELDAMWAGLVDDPGTVVLANAMPASGKTALAQQFARVASGHFRDILWIGCGDRPAVSIAGEIASQLGVSLAASIGLLREHRLLLVFDDATGELPIADLSGGRTSVLITTRRLDLKWPNAQINEVESTTSVTPAQAPTDAVELRLFEAMSACRPQDLRLELAARIAGIDALEARAIAQRLVERRCVDALDAAGARFRRTQARKPVLLGRHGEVLNEIFSDWRAHPERCRNLVAEIEASFEWALSSDWALATRLGTRAFAFLSAEARLPEAVQIYFLLSDAARERQDMDVVEICLRELSWIQDEEGGVRPSPVAAGQLAFNF